MNNTVGLNSIEIEALYNNVREGWDAHELHEGTFHQDETIGHIAENENTSPELLREIYKVAGACSDDMCAEIIHHVLQNPTAPTELLFARAEAFSGVWYEADSIFIARNPAAPDAVLRLLVGVDNGGTPWEIAKHSNASEATLLAMLDYEYGDAGIHKVIADRDDLTQTLAKRLANDEDASVRKTVLRNRAQGQYVAPLLFNDEEDWIAEEARNIVKASL